MMQTLQQDQLPQEQDGERIVIMFVLPEIKASVTEIFTVADLHGVVIKFGIHHKTNAEFSASKTTTMY